MASIGREGLSSNSVPLVFVLRLLFSYNQEKEATDSAKSELLSKRSKTVNKQVGKQVGEGSWPTTGAKNLIYFFLIFYVLYTTTTKSVQNDTPLPSTCPSTNRC
jgi:hypothetical protein